MKYAKNVPACALTVTSDDGIKTKKLTRDDFSDVVNDCIWLNGLKQKLVDKAASAKSISAATGEDADVIRERMVWECVDQLLSGDWAQKGEGVGRVSYLAEAIVELYGVSLETAREKVAAMDADKKKAFEANPKVAAKVAKLKAEAAERAAKKAAEGIDEEDDEMPEL